MYYQDNQSILEKEQVSQVHDAHGSWMEPIIKYLETRELPNDELQANRIRIKSARCSMIGDQLYRRSYSGPYLKCLDPKKAKYVLSELHERVCGNHPDGRTLADIPTLGSLAYGKRSFSKLWIAMLNSLCKNGDFGTFHLELGKQLSCLPKAISSSFQLQIIHGLKRWILDFLSFQMESVLITSLPQANEQAEVTNKSRLDALRKRLQGARGHWVEELLGVVWAYQTMPRCPTEKTHFSLAYDMKVVISTEVGMPTFQTT
ncbi:hypothetical protein CK203_085864 [Vitis vinifera]|uniref:Uncharacterized protein n=1 Tax=Vitis vinifera TaxID=29760 RepID=A0A438DIG4_VITVI|nr:hypothetical protein CK203_085864 [Vitis vinifera]